MASNPNILTQPALKPPIKWVGGKSWIAPYIQELLDLTNAAALIEPFAGSGSLTFALQPKKAILNDICFPLINFYSYLQRDGKVKVNYEMTEQEYYIIRERFNEVKEDKSDLDLLANDFYYLNRAGFNGLYRENRKGKFNTPWGKRKSIKPCEVGKDSLTNFVFTNDDYQKVPLPKSGFIYADPPYLTNFSSYHKLGWDLEDFKILLNWLLSTQLPFAVSNQNNETIVGILDELGIEYKIIELARAMDRKKTKEILAYRY